MIITDFLEKNARLYGAETALVEINPSEERDKAVTWWDFNLIESADPDAPYRREMSWRVPSSVTIFNSSLPTKKNS